MKKDDVITLSIDLPEYGLVSGKHGFIVAVHEQPEPSCTVEFLDRVGNTLVQLVLKPEQFKIMWSA
ncbi:MAG: DUF4926 domain-containing protein [Alphaproteobacteria bacterium]|nr:DUF4926 domain-containing protein [Alphaproteobacteria bacterium]MBP7758286.1 DUF4926 domain-containing protein [Alphaproteobacteria bacterium]MBP7761571.1 DUF4926 domain-containing protein [Alphaproteobacteria bacterium]MBP7906066.1 DUF4926 domain-containing protein [Alphaproteobacteria bacterium]